MVSYFPVIYPDELLYSVLARYYRHTASRSPKRTLDDLFGERTVRATVDLPGHLGALSRRLPAERCLAPERLAAELTLFPYHVAFQPASGVREVLTAMIDGATDSVHVRLGLTASIVPAPDTLRFCPQCFADAVARWGEPYGGEATSCRASWSVPNTAFRFATAPYTRVSAASMNFRLPRQRHAPTAPASRHGKRMNVACLC